MNKVLVSALAVSAAAASVAAPAPAQAQPARPVVLSPAELDAVKGGVGLPTNVRLPTVEVEVDVPFLSFLRLPSIRI